MKAIGFKKHLKIDDPESLIDFDMEKIQLMEMDTDCLAFAFAHSNYDDCVKPELRNKYNKIKGDWIALTAERTKTKGIVKEEKQGDGMINLGAKCFSFYNIWC